MLAAKRGDLVELHGLPGVIVGLAGEYVGDSLIPEDHVALWYGAPHATATGDKTTGWGPTEVWTVPLEYVEPGQVPTVRH
ncbi:MAG TPA: hypothetical protein VF690_04380 [Hymenobacter sp.]|jgi:hypothetical protein